MKLLTHKKKPQNVVVYGRGIDSYWIIQGLLQKNVNPKNIILAIPKL